MDAKIARESLRGVEGLVSYHLEEKAARPGLDMQFAATAQPHIGYHGNSMILSWLEQLLQVGQSTRSVCLPMLQNSSHFPPLRLPAYPHTLNAPCTL